MNIAGSESMVNLECGGAGEYMGSVKDVLSRLLMLPWWRLILCLEAQTVGKLLNALLCPLQDI